MGGPPPIPSSPPSQLVGPVLLSLSMTNSKQSLLRSRSALKQCCIATTLFTSGCGGTAAPQALPWSSVFCTVPQLPRPQKLPATQSLQHPFGSVLGWEAEVLGSLDISATCPQGGLGKSQSLLFFTFSSSLFILNCGSWLLP